MHIYLHTTISYWADLTRPVKLRPLLALCFLHPLQLFTLFARFFVPMWMNHCWGEREKLKRMPSLLEHSHLINWFSNKCHMIEIGCSVCLPKLSRAFVDSLVVPIDLTYPPLQTLYKCSDQTLRQWKLSHWRKDVRDDLSSIARKPRASPGAKWRIP